MYEFVIREDGTIVKRETVEFSVDINPAIEKAFQSNLAVRTANVVDFTDMGEPYFGKCALSMQTGDMTKMWASVRVKTLNLHTTFKIENEVMTPTFEAEGKFMEVPWVAPDTMRLVLGMTINATPELMQYKLGKHWLIAYDSKGASYKLPLSNLYDHLELCHGQAHAIQPTMMGAVFIGLQAFRKSKWNSDLRNANTRENAPKMFRFKALNVGFEQLPFGDTWHKLCTKASSEIVSTRLQPIGL